MNEPYPYNSIVCRGSWNGHDIFTIKFTGCGAYFKRFINSLVDDFNEPKFGYNGEHYDE